MYPQSQRYTSLPHFCRHLNPFNPGRVSLYGTRNIKFCRSRVFHLDATSNCLLDSMSSRVPFRQIELSATMIVSRYPLPTTLLVDQPCLVVVFGRSRLWQLHGIVARGWSLAACRKSVKTREAPAHQWSLQKGTGSALCFEGSLF